MPNPSDETSFYRLVVQCVARSEIKLNTALEQLARLVAKRTKGDDQRSLKYLRGVITQKNEQLRKQKKYIRELERELRLK